LEDAQGVDTLNFALQAIGVNVNLATGLAFAGTSLSGTPLKVGPEFQASRIITNNGVIETFRGAYNSFTTTFSDGSFLVTWAAESYDYV
jgi:hypothetical protein